LIDSVLEAARLNHREVFVDTHRDNVVARRFYEQVGFVQVAETKLSVVFRW
jgi:predicted GNAT family acetyltransferase